MIYGVYICHRGGWMHYGDVKDPLKCIIDDRTIYCLRPYVGEMEMRPRYEDTLYILKRPRTAGGQNVPVYQGRIR